MEEVLFRFAVVWIVLHIILFFVEMYRYKHSSWSWHGFKNEGMLDLTYGVLFTDQVVGGLAIIIGLGYWILQPMLN